jgi:hypothetical protein
MRDFKAGMIGPWDQALWNVYYGFKMSKLGAHVGKFFCLIQIRVYIMD